jgi:CheY-like chemotaxis protein
MVHGLAQQLGGGVRISSRPGLGTHVELWLPVALEAARPPQQSVTAIRPLIQARGRALLVDDEATVRASTAHMLDEIGFDVLEAESAEQALELLRSGENVTLLVSDHLMPGMDGTQLVRAVQSLRPDLPCLIVSGYAEEDGIAPDLPRLSKPFRSEELAAALRGIAR